MEHRRLGPFEVLERLGAGGMGQVWAARHVDLDLPVAIKVITGELAEQPRFRAAFADEVRAVAGMRHRGIVEVFDYGTAPDGGPFPTGSPYLVMARADASIRQDPPAGWPAVRSMLLEVLDGLAHAHARGVIHLDLKPGNLLRFDGRVAITDFGVATFMGEAVTRNAVRGSAAYMAPEQFAGRWRDYCPATDLYALGTVAWELLCGDVPFRATDPTTLGNLKRTSGPPRLPAGMAPPALRAWLESMLATEAGDRFQRAADAAAALREIPPDAPVQLGQVVGARADATLSLSTLSDDAVWAGSSAPAISPVPAATPAPAPTATEWRSSGARPELLREALGLGLFDFRPPPFVGREAEREQLWGELLAVQRTGAPRAVLVRGVQGVGASRLCTWLALRADEVGNAIAVRAGSDEDLADLWRRVLLLDGLTSAERLTQLVVGRAGLTEELARSVSALVEPGNALGPRERTAIQVELLEALAVRRPVVLALDRLDGPGERAELARAAIHRVRGPVLVLLTVRAEEAAEDPRLADQVAGLEAAGATTLDLSPLDDQHTRLLVERLISLEGGLSAELVARASGNPQVAVRLLSQWIEADVLIPGPRGFRLREGADPGALGDASWADRVAPLFELDAARRLAVELAAVTGQVVDRVVWEAACDGIDPEALLEVEDALLRRGLARSIPSGFAFAHPEIRRVLVERMGRSTRIAHHRWLAGTLQALGPGYAWRRGEHLHEGELWSEAVDALLSSVLDLWNRQHIQRCRAAIARAADAARRTGGERERWSRRVRAIEAYFAVHCGRYDEGLAVARELIEACARAGDERVLAQALRVRGLVAQRRGALEDAVADAERSALLFEAQGEADLGTITRTMWMQALLQLGRYDDAAAVADRFNPQRPTTVVSAEGARGILHTYRGEWEPALEHFGRALEVAREHGMRVAEAGIVGNLGDAWRYLGDLERAERYTGQAIAIARSLGLAGEPVLRLNHVQLLLEVGDVDGAWDQLEVALAGLERLGRAGLLGAAHAVALRVVALREDWERWPLHFERATALLAESGMAEPEVAEAFERAAELAAEAGHAGWAESARRQAAIQRSLLDRR